MKAVSILIVGGQGTYEGGQYHTEYPDRNLSIEYMMQVAEIARANRFNYVIPSGGFTQAATPGLSEARSFEGVWDETQTVPAATILLDEVALDSAENLIYSLMRFRMEDVRVEISRIGFLSQWHFKKRRMNATASALDIGKRFYFFGHAHANQANAGELAETGERKQFELMERDGDFLLRGAEWEQKRCARYKGVTSYAERDRELREAFPSVFAALDAMRKTTIKELEPLLGLTPQMDLAEAAKQLRVAKLERLQAAFNEAVMMPQGVLANT